MQACTAISCLLPQLGEDSGQRGAEAHVSHPHPLGLPAQAPARQRLGVCAAPGEASTASCIQAGVPACWLLLLEVGCLPGWCWPLLTCGELSGAAAAAGAPLLLPPVPAALLPCKPLQVDLRGAIQAGISFCRAANGAVLSEGPIPLQFVHRIRRRDLPQQWQREMPNRERLLREEADQ